MLHAARRLPRHVTSLLWERTGVVAAAFAPASSRAATQAACPRWAARNSGVYPSYALNAHRERRLKGQLQRR